LVWQSLINGFGFTTESKVNSKYRSYYDGGNNEKYAMIKTLTESRNINDIRPERCKGRLTNIPVMPVATKVMELGLMKLHPYRDGIAAIICFKTTAKGAASPGHEQER